MDLKRIAELYRDVVSWIGELILKDEIRLRDVPPDIRRSSDLIYISAFRASRSCSCNRFISDVKVLCEDIITLYYNDDCRKSRLVALLNDTLQLSDYKGDERFEAFKNDMDEIVMRELHDYKYVHAKQLGALIESYRAKGK